MLPIPLIAAVVGVKQYDVTLTNTIISSSDSATPVRATVILNSDGTVDKRENGVVTQINASTDWVIPNGDASGDFDAKWTVVGDAPTEVTGGWSSDTYAALSSNLVVGYSNSVLGTETGVFTITIRDPLGLTTSATFDITAEVTV